MANGMITSRLYIVEDDLATYPEWGRKCHQNDKMMAKSATTHNKQRVQGKNPLQDQHLDGDIFNAYLAVNLRCIKAVRIER